MANFDESRYIVKAKVSKDWKEKEGNISEDWIQGCLVIDNSRKGNCFQYRIQPTRCRHAFAFPVDSETICKSTGQKDKNNCLIFEHDLCVVNVGAFLFTTQKPDELFEVLWDENTSNYYLTNKDNSLVYTFVDVSGSECEVVGNAFDKVLLQKDAERTLFVGDKSKEEIANWLKSNAKLGTAYATFEDGSKATILIFRNEQTADIYLPDGVMITDATLDEVSEELVKVNLSKENEKEFDR